MTYLHSQSDPFDPLTIDVEHEFEARYWTRVLGISRAQLRKAIDTAGSCNAYLVARCAGRDLAELARLPE